MSLDAADCRPQISADKEETHTDNTLRITVSVL